MNDDLLICAVQFRKIFISILFHLIDSNASDKYIRKHLSIAGVTEDEIAELFGEK